MPALPSLFLMLYFLMFSVDYALTFLLRFPSDAASLALSYPAIAILSFAFGRSKSLFSAIFGIYAVDQRHWKALALLPISMAFSIILLIILRPPYITYVHPGLAEWVMNEGATVTVWLSIAMAMIAPLCFLAYSMIARDRKSRIKSLIIALSFFALVFLVDFQEPFGAVLPLPVRRALVLVAMVFLYEGFTL